MFFRIISEHKVNGFFVAPTALRAIKMVDPNTVEGTVYILGQLICFGTFNSFLAGLGRNLVQGRRNGRNTPRIASFENT